MQMSSRSVAQANQCFNYSCECCCSMGLRIECDKCAIRVMHEKIVASLHGIGFDAMGFTPA